MDLLKNFGLLAVAALCAAGGLAYEGGTYALVGFLLAALAFCAQVVLVSPRNGALVTALLAAGCNAYLLSRKFSSSGESACNIGTTFNCDAVNSSAASEMFGLPITLYGVAFYAGLALAGLLADRKDTRFDQINGLFAIVNLGYSAYLAYEANKIGAACVLCITIYAANGILLWSAIAALKQGGGQLFTAIDKLFGTSALWTLTATFAVVTLIGASSWSDHQAKSPTAMLTQPRPAPAPTPGSAPQPAMPRFTAEQLRTLYGRPEGIVETDGTEPILGDPNSPITVVEFADYGCPHCAQAAPELKQVIATYPQVHLRFKAFPLSGSCNPVIESPEGVERCKAAMAAECAGAQGKYFELSNALFTNLGYRSDDDIAYMAKQVEGLDYARWQACVNEPSTLEAVRADAIAGMKAGVHGTPAIYVKGLVGDGFVEIVQGGPQALQVLVEAKLDGMELIAP